jgi:raw score 5.43
MNSGKRRRKIKINSSMWKILKDIAKKNKRQLFLTFLLVAMENLMAILYPLFAGFAINAVVKGDVLHVLSYAVVVFVMWTIGMLRRRVDTQVFTKIYAEMAGL